MGVYVYAALIAGLPTVPIGYEPFGETAVGGLDVDPSEAATKHCVLFEASFETGDPSFVEEDLKFAFVRVHD
jgi:hypothetical protein